MLVGSGSARGGAGHLRGEGEHEWFGVERRARACWDGEEGGGCGDAGQLDEGTPSHRVIVLPTGRAGRLCFGLVVVAGAGSGRACGRAARTARTGWSSPRSQARIIRTRASCAATGSLAARRSWRASSGTSHPRDLRHSRRSLQLIPVIAHTLASPSGRGARCDAPGYARGAPSRHYRTTARYRWTGFRLLARDVEEASAMTRAAGSGTGRGAVLGGGQ